MATVVATVILVVGIGTWGSPARTVHSVACDEARSDVSTSFPALTILTERSPLRAVVYNLHSGLGPDWRLFRAGAAVERDIRAIARHIADAAPPHEPVDVIGLNEADFGSRRSGWLDQPAIIADELKAITGYRYRVLRAETWRRDVPGLEVRFGNALLVRHPVVSEHACLLGSTCTNPPIGASHWPGETRGLVRARLDVHGHVMDVLLTHLESVVMQQRQDQAAEILMTVEQLGDGPVLLLGDTNAVPSEQTRTRRFFSADRTHDILTNGALIDARVARASAGGSSDSDWATYPARQPQWPLDGVFATSQLVPARVDVIGNLESDHRGLVVAYDWLTEESMRAYRNWRDERARGPACLPEL